MSIMIGSDHHDTRTREGIARPHRRIFTRHTPEELLLSRRRFDTFKSSAIDAYSGVVGSFMEGFSCCVGEQECEELNEESDRPGAVNEAVEVASLLLPPIPTPPPSSSTACTLHASDSGLEYPEMEVDIVDAYFENGPTQINISLLDSITLEAPVCAPRVFYDPYAPPAVSDHAFSSVNAALTAADGAMADSGVTLDGKPPSDACSVEVSSADDPSIQALEVADSDEARLNGLTSEDEKDTSVDQQTDLSIMHHDTQSATLEQPRTVDTLPNDEQNIERPDRSVGDESPEPASNWNELPYFAYPQDTCLIEEFRDTHEAFLESVSLSVVPAEDSLASLSSMVTSSSSFYYPSPGASRADELVNESDSENHENEEEEPERTLSLDCSLGEPGSTVDPSSWPLGPTPSTLESDDIRAIGNDSNSLEDLEDLRAYFDSLLTSTSGHATQCDSSTPSGGKSAPLSNIQEPTRLEYPTNTRLDRIVEESEDEQEEFVDSAVQHAARSEDSIVSLVSMVSSSSSFCCAGLDMADTFGMTREEGNNDDDKDPKSVLPLSDVLDEPSVSHGGFTQFAISETPALKNGKVASSDGDVQHDHNDPEDPHALCSVSCEPAFSCSVDHEDLVLVASGDDKTSCLEATQLDDEATPVRNSRDLARFVNPEGNRLSRILEDPEDLQVESAILGPAAETNDIALQSLEELSRPAVITPEAPEVVVVTCKSGQTASSNSCASSSRVDVQSQELGSIYQPSDIAVSSSKQVQPATRQAPGPSHTARRANRKAVSTISRYTSSIVSPSCNSASVAGDEIPSTRPHPAVKIVSISKKSNISGPAPKEKKCENATQPIIDSIHQPTLDVSRRKPTTREGVAQTAPVTKFIPAIIVLSPEGHAVRLDEGTLPNRGGPPVISYDDFGRIRGSFIEDATINDTHEPLCVRQESIPIGNGIPTVQRRDRPQSCATPSRCAPVPVSSRDNTAIQRGARSRSISSSKDRPKSPKSQQVVRARKRHNYLASASPPPSASARRAPPDPTRLMQLFTTGEDDESAIEFELAPKCGSAMIECVHSLRSIHSVPEEEDQEVEDALDSGSSSAESTPPVTPVSSTFPPPDVLLHTLADSKPSATLVSGSRIRVVYGSRRSDVGDGRPF
ncbi:hypothetical protein BDV93DRAFT_511932 [Ceratobasidium sp. AG-I]|nr:hypothetical protein BDV93DRAFT_511932 [Ceratobasidium sp. AG-I]